MGGPAGAKEVRQMVQYDYNKLRDPRDKRLAREHELIDELCGRSSKISYEIVKQVPGFPPEGYKIIYRDIRSIVGTNPDDSPVYRTHHEAEIIFPPAYPGADGAPRCRMLTDTWHPNIRSKEPAKGRICINSKALGAWHTLDMLTMRIGQMLQYRNYHALDEDPWPEDAEVARWVREYAEPHGVVDKAKKIYTDDSELLDPESVGMDFSMDVLPDESTDDPTDDRFSFSGRGSNPRPIPVNQEDDWGMAFERRTRVAAAKTEKEKNLDFDFKTRD